MKVEKFKYSLQSGWYFPSKPSNDVLSLPPSTLLPHSVPPAVRVDGNTGQNNLGGIFHFFLTMFHIQIDRHLDTPSKYIQNLATSHPLPAPTIVHAISSVSGSLQWPHNWESLASQPNNHSGPFRSNINQIMLLRFKLSKYFPIPEM